MAILEPRNGAWIEPDDLARRIEGIRVGARFRGLEVTVRGTLERRSGGLFISFAGRVLRLVPLAAKIHLDPKTAEPESPTEREREAYQGLEGFAAEARDVRVSGPLANEREGAVRTLQVRTFQILDPRQARCEALRLGIDVNGPYGLGEPWVLIREGLGRLDAVASVDRLPDLKNGTCQLVPKNGFLPDVSAIEQCLRALRAGVSLRDVEATIEGVPKARQGNQLVFELGAPDRSIVLAALSARSDEKSGQGSQPNAGGAHAGLIEELQRLERPVRIVGPIKAEAGKWILEVRRYVLDPDLADGLEQHAPAREDSGEDAPSHAVEPHDITPPAPPRNLQARVEGELMILDWDDNEEADFGSYNIFRSTASQSGYIQVAAGIVRSQYTWRIGDDASPYHFVVTATDWIGNQSAYSNEAALPRPTGGN